MPSEEHRNKNCVTKIQTLASAILLGLNMIEISSKTSEKGTLTIVRPVENRRSELGGVCEFEFRISRGDFFFRALRGAFCGPEPRKLQSRKRNRAVSITEEPCASRAHFQKRTNHTGREPSNCHHPVLVVQNHLRHKSKYLRRHRPLIFLDLF